MPSIQQYVVLSYQGEGFACEDPSDAYGPFASEIVARQWAVANVGKIGQWGAVPLHPPCICCEPNGVYNVVPAPIDGKVQLVCALCGRQV